MSSSSRSGELTGLPDSNSYREPTQKSLLRRVWAIRMLYLMFLPAIVYFLVFQYAPMFGVLIAFQQYNPFLGIRGSTWVGFRQFSQLFSDPYFYVLLRNTLILSVYATVFGFPFPILFALLLNEVRFSAPKRLIQTITFFPYFVSTAVAVGMLYTLLSPHSGLVNVALGRLFGMDPIFFMARPRYFRALYVILSIWRRFGYVAIIYLAAMAAIDPCLYEAGEVDGIGRFRRMWNITLPGISNTVVILLILEMGGLLTVGTELILLMYNPSTYPVADVIQTYVYRRGFGVGGFPNHSYAAAVGLFNSVIAMLLVITANLLARRYTEARLF